MVFTGDPSPELQGPDDRGRKRHAVHLKPLFVLTRSSVVI